MYLLRGIVVSLAAFFLVYAALSGILVCAWRKLAAKRAVRSASVLYGMRMLPLAAACGLVVLFTVPSFVTLEPRSIEEKTGMIAFALAGAGAMVFLVGIWRSARAWLGTSRTLAACLKSARELDTRNGIRAYEVQDVGAVLFVAGVWRPRLVVSSRTMELLDADEMQSAIQHELAHVTHRDNLKKVTLRLCALPWLDSLEREWLRAAEEAADAAAARDGKTALHLASALIKMTRAPVRMTAPELAMGLVPPNDASISARVQRLLSGKRDACGNHRVLWWVSIASAALAVSINYAWALMQMHEITELLVR